MENQGLARCRVAEGYSGAAAVVQLLPFMINLPGVGGLYSLSSQLFSDSVRPV